MALTPEEEQWVKDQYAVQDVQAAIDALPETIDYNATLQEKANALAVPAAVLFNDIQAAKNMYEDYAQKLRELLLSGQRDDETIKLYQEIMDSFSNALNTAQKDYDNQVAIIEEQYRVILEQKKAALEDAKLRVPGIDKLP